MALPESLRGRVSAMVFGTIVLCYCLMLFVPIHRLFWYDELHTVYISQAPTLSRMLQEINLFDQNPPLIYTLVRITRRVLGESEAAIRFPFTLAFLIASLGFVQFLSRRIGVIWAAAGIALFWCSTYFYYATEVRPYALLLAFFSVALVSWDYTSFDSAGPRPRRSLALIGLAFGIIGMLSSHIFSLLSLAVLYAAQLTRSLRRREIDWPVWAAMLLPLLATLLWIPVVRSQAAILPFRLFPPITLGGPRKVPIFFAKAALAVAFPFCIAAIAAWIFRDRSKDRESTTSPLPEPHAVSMAAEDVTLMVGLLSLPVVLNLAMLIHPVSFFERYCITSAVAFYVLVTLILRRFVGTGPRPATVVLCVFLVFGMEQEFFVPELRAKSPDPTMSQMDPPLPIVAAGALTFLEMDHYEPPHILDKLYYLTSEKGVIEFHAANIGENMHDLKKVFPIRANVAFYEDFVSAHDHFLVLGTLSISYDWLLRKLIHDGAQVNRIARISSPYPDQDIYDVVVTPQLRTTLGARVVHALE